MPPKDAPQPNPKLAKLQQMSEAVRIGGKGTQRRKHKAPHKTNAADDKKLQAALKKFGVQPIAEIEEVNLIMENNTVIHFPNPKVQASIPSNIYVVSGPNETKKLQDIIPQFANLLSGLDKLSTAEAAPASADATKKEPESFPEATFDA